MFDPEMRAESKEIATPDVASPRRAGLRRIRWGVGLGALACATLLVWGLVDNVQEQADRLH